tara:strand:- start:61 stop:756 length:696 start_codon:yes stop_codon:yes gene_type:complete
MKSYAITLKGNKISEQGFDALWLSSKKLGNDFNIEKFEATDHIKVGEEMSRWDLFWNYPWEGKVTDLATGLIKSAYPTVVKTKRMAAAVSHFRLWTECFEKKEPILILEHDAIFRKKLNYQLLLDSKYDIIGINEPRGATRKSAEFHRLIQKNKNEIQPVPSVDNYNIPQGIAGNSAYIIKPEAAEKLISLCFNHGLWPNDAIMCKQLVDNLGVSRTYYTNIQRLQSTTTT